MLGEDSILNISQDMEFTKGVDNMEMRSKRMVDSEVNGVLDGKGDNKESICVIGSGNFGRALAGRLATAGYKVSIASRDPERNRWAELSKYCIATRH
jgi:ketol-acid reductoisomerase